MNPDLLAEKKYVEIVTAQAPKKQSQICGDYIITDRTEEATTVILADGMGTGVKANIAAVMNASRLMELLRLGFSLREACKKLVDTLHEARTSNIPFAAFSVCRILNSGHATIISYEMPSPILLSKHFATYLPHQRFFTMGLEIISEVNCVLEYGDGIIMVSDGVSQAGMGRQFRMGWGIQNASYFIDGLLTQGIDIKEIPNKVLQKVKEICISDYGDDTTCVLMMCRESNVLNVLTGPPLKKTDDERVVKGFMEMKGKKVICGSTTVEIVSKCLKTKAIMIEEPEGYHKPPSYKIEGIDFASEGAITLNQIYNIIDMQPEKLVGSSAVTTLARIFHESDVINFIVGTATNRAHKSFIFRQMGIFPREVIVKLLSERLKKIGKIVNIEYV
ncbi:MAG TPA: SpoIIE family protein phosphatase [Syntrophorhabdaceae bacterium]|nr:SpoIIE family protein phosphatase [Syntrophorhabdaceae bacterium]HPU29128.1 SpoIIE family protein phosphatase [Syntrophorhabdaceae bacterium]